MRRPLRTDEAQQNCPAPGASAFTSRTSPPQSAAENAVTFAEETTATDATSNTPPCAPEGGKSRRSCPMRGWHCQNGRTRYSCHSPSPIHSKLTDCFCVGPLPGSIQKISPVPARFPFARNTISCAADEARSNAPL